MKTTFLLILTVAVLLASGRRATAQDSSADSRPNFNSFQLIERNNIFNPNRRPYIPFTNGPRPPQVYYFTLRGAMTYENKNYAFFEGTGVNRNGTFSASDTINGYTISEITNNTVKLAASSNQFITLKVGMQMRREGDGPWKLVASSEPASDSSSSDSTSPASDDGSGAASSMPSIKGADSDVMMRLMKRRAEENGDTNSPTPNGQ